MSLPDTAKALQTQARCGFAARARRAGGINGGISLSRAAQERRGFGETVEFIVEASS
jgi:hypothetical protein